MATAIQFRPPVTSIEPVTDIVHGIPITDPYRWLEDQNSPRTRAWLEAQTAYARTYIDSLPMRDSIRRRLSETVRASAACDPWYVRGRYYFLKRYDASERAVIVTTNESARCETVLVDPTVRHADRQTSVGIVDISRDCRILAYSVRDSGSDQAAIEFLDIEQHETLADSLPAGLWTGFSFSSDNSGFYYSLRDVRQVQSSRCEVLWHRFGTQRSEDKTIFSVGGGPNYFLHILHSSEAGLLVHVLVSTGKVRTTSLYLQSTSANATPRLLIRDITGIFLPFFVGTQLFAYTNLDAPNFRIVRIDLTSPKPICWHNIVGESDRRMQQLAVVGDRIFITRVDGFRVVLEMFRIDGAQERAPAVPYDGTIDLLNRVRTSEKLFYSCTSLCEPPTIFSYDPQSGQTRTWEKVAAPFDPSTVSVKEVTCYSSDGTPIPVLLAAKNDLLMSSPLPTFVTGYGGFGSCVTPRFSILASFLIDQGFLFVVPAIRGGGELGEEWHLAGQGRRRQKAFDDFLSVTDWLISEHLSAPQQIAVGGGSNAGLLVGAVVTQRPNLFRAAICLGPLFDMIRYELFDFASDWVDEYGSVNDQEDLKALLAYSPYHRVEEGVEYPAVLIISGDADTRCNPMHARKMTARLQAATRSPHPILLDYKPAWGHVPAQSLTVKINSLSDRLAFICQELGILIDAKRTAKC